MRYKSRIEHGRLVTYSRHKCRCKACREVWNEYYRNYRAKTKARIEELEKEVAVLRNQGYRRA